MSPREQISAIQADTARISELRMELIEEMHHLDVIDPLEPRCIECGATENLRDSEECWDCRDMKKAAGREQAGADSAYAERHEREVA
jgi:ribosomal protein L37AE/L43A